MDGDGRATHGWLERVRDRVLPVAPLSPNWIPACADMRGRVVKAISRNNYTTLTGLAVRLLRCAKGHIGPAMLALARLADERQSFASWYIYSWQ